VPHYQDGFWTHLARVFGLRSPTFHLYLPRGMQASRAHVVPAVTRRYHAAFSGDDPLIGTAVDLCCRRTLPAYHAHYTDNASCANCVARHTTLRPASPWRLYTRL